jgi:hypothetical protein
MVTTPEKRARPTSILKIWTTLWEAGLVMLMMIPSVTQRFRKSSLSVLLLL